MPGKMMRLYPAEHAMVPALAARIRASTKIQSLASAPA